MMHKHYASIINRKLLPCCLFVGVLSPSNILDHVKDKLIGSFPPQHSLLSTLSHLLPGSSDYWSSTAILCQRDFACVAPPSCTRIN